MFLASGLNQDLCPWTSNTAVVNASNFCDAGPTCFNGTTDPSNC